MLLFSGTILEASGDNAPTLLELGVQCGKMPRFCGSCHKHWTVLHHQYVVETICVDLLQSKRKAYRESVRIYALIHDAHEAIIGDIPTPFKHPMQREIQHALDVRIWRGLGIPPQPQDYEQWIKEADRQALLAEGYVCTGGDAWMRMYADARRRNGNPLKKEELRHFDRNCAIVEMCQSAYSSPLSTWGPDSPGVKDWVSDVEAALLAIAA